MTVIASIEDKEPTFHSSPPTSQPSAHAQSEASSSSASFVTSDQLKQISDQWTEQFARFEALLSRGNVFCTPKSTVKPVPTHTVVSDTSFIPPSARLTGPVDVPAQGEVGLSQDNTGSYKDPKDDKEKKKSRKSRKESRDKDRESKKRQVSPSPEIRTTTRSEVKPTPVHAKPLVQAQATSSPVVQPAQTKPIPVHTVASHPTPQEYFQPGATGQEALHPGSAGQNLPSTSLFGDSSLTSAYNVPPEPDTLDIDPPLSDASACYSDDQASSDEGEISSDTLDKPEQMEDMNYRETVRSIRSFMG